MKFIIIEEFPEGNFNIPLKDSGEQAVFDSDDLEEARKFKDNLQDGQIYCPVK